MTIHHIKNISIIVATIEHITPIVKIVNIIISIGGINLSHIKHIITYTISFNISLLSIK